MRDRVQHLLVSCADGVLRVTLNRPDKRNALSRALLADLAAAFNDHRDHGLRYAVLGGAGDASFAAGGDLAELAHVRSEEDATALSSQSRVALDAIRQFPVPVIAALNGDALGGGAELAVAADFRVAATHARIGFIHGKLRIVTAWGGAMDLARLVGSARALRLICRQDTVTAEEALALGLVDAVAPEGGLAEAVETFAAPMQAQSPHVLRAAKTLQLAVRAGEPVDRLAALETRLFVGAWLHEDHWRAADKVLKRTAP